MCAPPCVHPPVCTPREVHTPAHTPRTDGLIGRCSNCIQALAHALPPSVAGTRDTPRDRAVKRQRL